MRRPGEMRGGAGGRLEAGLRSADLNLRIEIGVMEFCFGSDTPALVYDKGGGFNRSVHSARPSKEPWEWRGDDRNGT